MLTGLVAVEMGEYLKDAIVDWRNVLCAYFEIAYDAYMIYAQQNYLVS